MKQEHLEFIKNIASIMMEFGFRRDVANWVGCQFALESNYGRSTLARKKNNFCGMRVPSLRPTLCLFSSAGFAAYHSLRDCCTDFVLLLAYNRFNCFDFSDVDSFSDKLVAKKYCPEKDYIDKVNQIYSQFNSQNHE